MSLALLVSSHFLRPSATAVFQATGGAPPYTYSLVAGGDGGSLSSSGIYQAPSSIAKGFQVVRVVDNVQDEVTTTIRFLSEIELLCLVLKNFMSLSDDQIYIYNQKINIPKDDRLYVAVKLVDVKPFGSKCTLNSAGQEVSSTNVLARVMVDIVSRSLEALYRKEQVVMALRSQFSQRVQTTNGIKIAELPNGFVDLSQLEGTAIPYRFNISLNMQYAVKVIKSGDFYDSFSFRLETSEGDVIIEGVDLSFLLADNDTFLVLDDNLGKIILGV